MRTVAASWRARWAGLSPREQWSVRWAVALVGLALVWLVLLAPALRTLQQAPAQRLALQQQADAMRQLEQQAKRLKAQPAVSVQDVEQQAEAIARTLGPDTQWVRQADTVRIRFGPVPGSTLAAVLARQPLQPIALQWTASNPTQDGSQTGVLWEGTLVYATSDSGTP